MLRASGRIGRSLGCAIVAMLLFGCQVSRNHPDARPSPESGDGFPWDLDAPLILQPPLTPAVDASLSRRPVLKLVTAERLAIADMVSPPCPSALTGPDLAGEDERELVLRLNLVTDYGATPILFFLRGNGSAEFVRVQVEGYRMAFAATTPLRSRLLAVACSAERTAAKDIVVEAAIYAQAHEWLELVAPDCRQITSAADGWHCRLSSIDPSAAAQELLGIQMTMIRRWNRQPYLLARRLAVGLTLAEDLTAAHPETALRRTCRIVQHSLPVELPLTLTNRRWQQVACASHPTAAQVPRMLEAARFGLAKTVAEIDFMRQLFERTSRLGSLTLKLPAGESPKQEVLISLSPAADVADNLTRETQRLSNGEPAGKRAPRRSSDDDDDDGDALVTDLPRACWHPLFAEDQGALDLARHLGLTGEAARVACAASQARHSPQAFATERYLAESITSETEFILTSGKSKTLRLPIGRYNFALRPLPDDPDQWDDAAQAKPRVSGEITWESRRPHAVITSW